MARNPMVLLQLKERIAIFSRQHPKVHPFLEAVRKNAIKEGSVLEMKITTPEGQEYVSNIRLTAEDLKTIEMLTDLRD